MSAKFARQRHGGSPRILLDLPYSPIPNLKPRTPNLETLIHNPLTSVIPQHAYSLRADTGGVPRAKHAVGEGRHGAVHGRGGGAWLEGGVDPAFWLLSQLCLANAGFARDEKLGIAMQLL